LKRRARIERRLILGLADGSTVTLDRGVCWIDPDGENPTVIWEGGDGLESGPISAEEVSLHLARRNFVFTSW